MSWEKQVLIISCIRIGERVKLHQMSIIKHTAISTTPRGAFFVYISGDHVSNYRSNKFKLTGLDM